MTDILCLVGEGTARGHIDGVMIAGGVLILMLIVGYFLIPRIRKKYHPKHAEKKSGFKEHSELESLHQMHANHLISDEEYRNAKRILMGIPHGKSAPGETQADSTENAPASENSQNSDTDSDQNDKMDSSEDA